MTSLRRIILVEDDPKKIDDIKAFLATKDFGVLTVKESYQSGLKELLTNHYDLLLLDMSIPTWDKSPVESGGNYQKFGGYKILKELVRKKKPLKTVLISMFDDFGESDTSITLTQLTAILQHEFPSIFLGSVFYNSQQHNWKENLNSLIETAV